MNAHDLVQEIIERKGKIENVFWIACGGSMIDLMPANELLKREATTFTSTVYTAREFCLMAPKSLGEKSLVIACSHSGNTQEVVDGCEMALAAGAEVVALTDCEGSKIDNGKWTTWVYPWGEGVPQAEVPQGIGALIAAELLDRLERGVVDGYGWPLIGIFDLGWHEKTKFRLEPGFYAIELGIQFSAATWKKLNPQQRAFLEKQAEWLEGQLARQAREDSVAEIKRQQDAGIQVVRLSDADAKVFLKNAYDAAWDGIVKASPTNGAKLRSLMAPK